MSTFMPAAALANLLKLWRALRNSDHVVLLPGSRARGSSLAVQDTSELSVRLCLGRRLRLGAGATIPCQQNVINSSIT